MASYNLINIVSDNWLLCKGSKPSLEQEALGERKSPPCLAWGWNSLGSRESLANVAQKWNKSWMVIRNVPVWTFFPWIISKNIIKSVYMFCAMLLTDWQTKIGDCITTAVCGGNRLTYYDLSMLLYNPNLNKSIQFCLFFVCFYHVCQCFIYCKDNCYLRMAIHPRTSY